MVAGPGWFGAGGKSGLHRAGCWVTPSLGDEQESATESKPPSAHRALDAADAARIGQSSGKGSVRVKR